MRSFIMNDSIYIEEFFKKTDHIIINNEDLIVLAYVSHCPKQRYSNLCLSFPFLDFLSSLTKYAE